MSWNVHIHVLCGRWKITGSGHSLRCYLTNSMTLVKTSVLNGCVICSSQLPQVIVLASLASTTCYGGDSTITIANHRREPMNIDVFNGDADGIFSLIQLRKEFAVAPSQQLLVTGVKRDHALLQHVTDQQAQGADIQVLDLPFDKNSAELPRLLKVARSVSYIDHHFATTQLTHKRLVTLFDFAPTVCTGLLVSAHLRHNQLIWAVPAAF